MQVVTLWIILILAGCSSTEFNKVFQDLQKDRPLTRSEVVQGLKEALSVGTSNASSRLSQTNGYLGNKLIRIPFPREAKVVEDNIRKIGLNRLADDFITSLNRAAERAAVKAKPIFISAIRKMTITDAMKILKGKDNEATLYFKKKTSSQLRQAFRPEIRQSLDKVDATKYWSKVMGAYNKIPFAKKVNTDLAGYVTYKALSGLFYVIGQEEKKIRKDPLARVSAILKRVFGYEE